MMTPESLERYLYELQLERDNLSPFAAALPHSFRLLNQEIVRVTTLLRNTPVLEQNVHGQAALLASGGIHSNEGANNTRPSPFLSEMPGCSINPSGPVVKRSFRIDMPIEQYPSHYFVGNLIGTKGNFLKKIEATTGCRVILRGRGSINDPQMEAALMEMPGHKHLSEALHLLIEAEMPVEMIDACLNQICDMLRKYTGLPHDYRMQQHLKELEPISGARGDVFPMTAPSTPFNMCPRPRMKRGNSGGG